MAVGQYLRGKQSFKTVSYTHLILLRVQHAGVDEQLFFCQRIFRKSPWQAECVAFSVAPNDEMCIRDRDALAGSIETLSDEVLRAGGKFTQIREMASVRMGGFEVDGRDEMCIRDR